MTKLMVQLSETPMAPAAVEACLGITSLGMTQVTGPKPTEKDATNDRIAVAASGAESVFRPKAKSTAEIDMNNAEKRMIGRDPTLCQSVSNDRSAIVGN
jgi:hypothetical protein